jgi:hypothetical protein
MKIVTPGSYYIVPNVLTLYTPLIARVKEEVEE